MRTISRGQRLARARRRAIALSVGVVVGAGLASVSISSPAAADPDREGMHLYLVTLDGPGTAGASHGLPASLQRLRLQAQQDAVLKLRGTGKVERTDAPATATPKQ